MTGLEFAQDHGAETRKRCSTCQYTNLQRRIARHIEISNSIRELPSVTVRRSNQQLDRFEYLVIADLYPSANENTQRQNKKTIQPKDVLDALKDIEFDFFESRLSQELEKYNNMQCDKRNTYRRRIKEEAKAKQTGDETNGIEDLTSETGAGAAAAVPNPKYAHLDPRDRPDPPGNTSDEGHVTYDEYDNKVRRKHVIRQPLRKDKNGREIWLHDGTNPRHIQNRRSLLQRKARKKGQTDGGVLPEDQSEYESLSEEMHVYMGGRRRAPKEEEHTQKRPRRGASPDIFTRKRLNREATQQRIHRNWREVEDGVVTSDEEPDRGMRLPGGELGYRSLPPVPYGIPADTDEEDRGEEAESEFESAEEEIEENGDNTKQDLTEDPLEAQEGDGDRDEDDEMLDGDESE